jgi:hypothetical protein
VQRVGGRRISLRELFILNPRPSSLDPQPRSFPNSPLYCHMLVLTPFFNYLQVDSEQRGLLLGVLRDMERDPESFTDRQIMVPRAVYL